MAGNEARDEQKNDYVAGLCAIIQRTAAEAGRCGGAADVIAAMRRGLEGDIGDGDGDGDGQAVAAGATLAGLGSGHALPEDGDGLSAAQCEAETMAAAAQLIGSIADRATAAALPDEKLAPVCRMTLGVVAQRGRQDDVTAALAAIGIDATPAAIAARIRKMMRERDQSIN